MTSNESSIDSDSSIDIESAIEDLKHILRTEGHTDEEICKGLLNGYVRNHPATPTKESVMVPPLDSVSAYHQKEWIKKNILPNVILQSDCETMDGNTQKGGKQLEDAFEKVLILQEIKYDKAGSQQPIDFRDVVPYQSWPWGRLFFECKKTNGNTIVLNDSIPKSGSWYIIYCVKTREVTVILADILIKHDIDKLKEYKRIIECHRHDFKTIGDYSSVARMTLGIDLRRYIESDQRVFWDICEDPPPLSNLKEEKAQAKQLAKEEKAQAKQLAKEENAQAKQLAKEDKELGQCLEKMFRSTF